MRYICVMSKKPKSGPYVAPSVLMPQVLVKQWVVDRVEVAVKLRQKTEPMRFSKADWMREAYTEKLERELGKAIE